MSKFVFVTGGVVSSIGKGVIAASLASLLEASGFKINILKLDPYLNVDCGTMNPNQHGEVFVTDDGAETDLDLGHYERFTNKKMQSLNNLTAGQAYEAVINKERSGGYLGATVQIIPHVTDEIKARIYTLAQDCDILFVEIGGTVGDIESLPFLEAIRQFSLEVGSDNFMYLHITLVPYLSMAGEVKTKPTQHSVKELRSIGISPDMLICRSEHAIDVITSNKIALFTNVAPKMVINCVDETSIYKVPLTLYANGIVTKVAEQLKLTIQTQNPALKWQDLLLKLSTKQQLITVALVGKYLNLTDSYKSLEEALQHCGNVHACDVHIKYIDAEKLNQENCALMFNDCAAIVVPGGFGIRGVAGKILAITYARTQKIPLLGICFGMQLIVIEYARYVLGLKDASSTEIDATSPNPVVALATQWLANDGTLQTRNAANNLGGSMRLGSYPCDLQANTLAQACYNEDIIFERHRHRYEINNQYADKLQAAGLIISGTSTSNKLIEIVELKDHPWFLGCQFHPEFKSNPILGHPIFNNFIKAAAS